jgi:transposase
MSLDEQAKTMEHQDIVALLASHGQLATRNTELVARNQELARQLAWFKQQLFGEKSERRFVNADSRQLALAEWRASVIAGREITVAEHHRRSRPRSEEPTDEDAVRFDETVPVEEIRLPHPTIEEEHEIVSEKTTLRLAQKPASYVILKFVRPVIKRKADGALTCPPAPASVLGKSVADVSLLACLVVDKFLYHLPLYRQHQRMAAAGVHLARSTLTGLIHRTGDLLEPIVEAQLASILQSHTLAMDETPIRAGIKSRGQMKTGYFWPIYGDRDEVVFPFSESRSGAILSEILGSYSGVLLSDGYVAYERHAEKHDAIVHAQCWSHTRRQFLKAEAVEPELTETALAYIARLYEADAVVKRKMVEDAKRAELRAERCKPIVDEFFEWLKTTLETKILLPRNPFTEAAGYALAREAALRVFLQFPNVPMDTNHLEREIRPIAVGRKNWLFCWTEVGAQHVGIFQSLLVTCRLHGIDPYTYLVDVLQRVDRHPASDVAALTPRVWKERFADEPLRSVIDRPVKNAVS